MDIVLDAIDDYALDSFWAWLLPLRLPLSDAQRVVASSSASNNSGNLIKSVLLPTASSSLAALTTMLPDPSSIAASQSEQWTTISSWPRDDWRRQTISVRLIRFLCIICMLTPHMCGCFIQVALYVHISVLLCAKLTQVNTVDHRMMKHPRFVKGQIRMEIKMSLIAFPTLTLLTVPWFVGEVRGYSLCYESIADGPWGGGVWGWAYLAASAAFFLWFTDLAIYFVHRWEHHPSVYKRIHKPHHRWVVPTPWASHAFHPLDGYAQSLPYHFFIFMFPLHKWVYLGLFAFVNLWTILIHDSDMIVDHPLENVINGPAHHTLHHLYFTCNYGQYFTWADKYWGSYRQPAKGDDPLLAVMAKHEKQQMSDAANAARQEAEYLLAVSNAEGLTPPEAKKDL